MIKMVQSFSMFCFLILKTISAMSCMPEKLVNQNIEEFQPPDKDGVIHLDDEIILVGNCTLSHNLKFTVNGKISIAHDAHLIITKEDFAFITISRIKQDNLIFESQSSTIDIDALTKFSCEEAIKHTVGTLHICREAKLVMAVDRFSHIFLEIFAVGPCWYPFRESFKICIDEESYGLFVDGVTILEGTFDHLENYYGR